MANSRLHLHLVSVSVDMVGLMGQGGAHVLFELQSTGENGGQTLLTLVLDTDVCRDSEGNPDWSEIAKAGASKLRDQLQQMVASLGERGVR